MAPEIYLLFCLISFTALATSYTQNSPILDIFLATIITAVYSLLVGTRSQDIGTDTSSYKNTYQNLNLSEGLQQTNFEPLYEFSMLASNFFNLPFYIYQTTLIFAITSIFLVVFKKNTRSFLFCQIILLTSPFLFTVIANVQRQGAASPFILLAFYLAFKNKILLATLAALIATLFHISAGIFFVASYIFFWLAVRKKMFMLLGYILTLIVAASSPELIASVANKLPDSYYLLQKIAHRSKRYLLEAEAATPSTQDFLNIIYIIFFTSIITLKRKTRIKEVNLLLQDTEKTKKIRNYILIGSFGVLFHIIFMPYNVITRIPSYIYPFFIIPVGILLEEITFQKKQPCEKLIGSTLAIAYASLICIQSYYGTILNF